MLLSNAQLDDGSFMHLERYVNDGSPSGFSRKFTTSETTSPHGTAESFHLCSVRFPQAVKVVEFGEEPAFFQKWQMLVHPDMIDDPMFSVCTEIDRAAALVAPTASSRTVKMLEAEGWFLKLCYKGMIGRIDRQLGMNHACSAVEVSRSIEQAIRAGLLPTNFGILREVFGRVIHIPTADSTYEWGIVLREPLPSPPKANLRAMIPGFALFSSDQRNPKDWSLLQQLVTAQDKAPADFLFEDLISPLCDAYFSLLLSCGLQLEAQAQNMLFGIDANFRVIAVIARDAESVDKDLSLMRELAIAQDYKSLDYKCLERGQYNYAIMHSFMFDFKLGEYLLTPLIDELGRHFEFDRHQLQERIRNHNRAHIRRLPSDFFPADGKWYWYENIVHDRAAKRPYIASPNPKYR